MAQIKPIEGLVLPSGAFEHAGMVREALQSMIGKVVVIHIKQKVKERSNPQSRYRWAVVVKDTQKFLFESGIIISDKDVNNLLKQVTGFYFHYEELNGVQIPVYEETLPQGTKKFEEWMEACRIWAHTTLGLVIPLPKDMDYYAWVSEQIEKEQK